MKESKKDRNKIALICNVYNPVLIDEKDFMHNSEVSNKLRYDYFYATVIEHIDFPIVLKVV